MPNWVGIEPSNDFGVVAIRPTATGYGFRLGYWNGTGNLMDLGNLTQFNTYSMMKAHPSYNILYVLSFEAQWYIVNITDPRFALEKKKKKHASKLIFSSLFKLQ